MSHERGPLAGPKYPKSCASDFPDADRRVLVGGALLIVGAQLVRTNESLYYSREGNDEVDFVLKKGRKLYAIEVKSGRKKSQKGLEVFKKKFPEARLVMITSENYFEFENDPMKFLEKA